MRRQSRQRVTGLSGGGVGGGPVSGGSEDGGSLSGSCRVRMEEVEEKAPNANAPKSDKVSKALKVVLDREGVQSAVELSKQRLAPTRNRQISLGPVKTAECTDHLIQ